MALALEKKIEGLKRTIAEMEAQRPALGDEAVDTALVPFQRKLEELVVTLEARKESLREEQMQQRKLVTLLFMDIVGSTQLSQHLDPEDVMTIIDGALRRLAEPVEAHGGRVTRFMGDGFLSVFGAPVAREDDPEQAVRAGLAIIELASEIADEYLVAWDIQSFQVRVGVNTGLVMLGGETETGNTLMGSPVNLAARLERAAPAGGLLVSHDTYRHIRGLFDVESQEPIQAKGFDEPVQVYRVLRTKARAFRTYTRGVEGVETRMIGRETEFKFLQDALLIAIEEGEGQVVTVSGEAGVGKSRLLYEFQNWIELLPPPAVRFYEGRGRQEAQGLPYGLLRDLFEFRFQIQEDDSRETAREKIETGFTEVFNEGDEGLMRAHILGQLLGFDFSASPQMKGVLGDAEQLRNRGLMYLGEYFKKESNQGPVVVFLDDIHWADDSSLDALNWLVERLHHQCLLVVSATRPMLYERRPYWGEGQTHHTRLDLHPLSRRESRQLLLEILKLADQVPSEMRDLVVEGAEGNPFYVEELVKMLVEDGVIVKGEETWQIHPKRLSEVEVPPTLVGVLQARLDSLPLEERTVLQQASVVGRLFWDRVVAYIQATGDSNSQLIPEALTALRQREMIFRREASAFADASEFIFKHDILREVTYETVLKRLRRKYHGLVADWLIAQSSDRVGEYSGLIAEHLLLAGRREAACQYFLQAGRAALGSFANAEAERYFRQALELSPADIQEAACFAGLGEVLLRQGRRQESISVFRSGIDLYIELEQGDKAAELYERISRILWYEDYRKAWNVCQEGLTRLEGAPQELPEGPGMARLLAEAGRTAHFIAKPAEEVIVLCQRAIEMAERQGDVKAKAEASITIALTMKNITKRIEFLQEVIAFSEENGLLYQAARARNNLGEAYREGYLSLESAKQIYLQAIDITLKIGDIEGMLFLLDSLTDNSIAMGHLETVQSDLEAILHRSTAPPSRVEEFLDEARSWLFSPRGEWRHALEFHRNRQGELRQGGSLQLIVKNNLWLANTCLELNRFGGMADILEAEAVLRKNIQIDLNSLESRFLLIVLISRQGRIIDAYKRLDEADDSLVQPEARHVKVYRLESGAELARVEARWDEAVSACQELIDIYQEGGYRWRWARRLIDLGDALLGRDGPGDREWAEEAYRQSQEMFTEMGAQGYVKALEERLGGIRR